MSSVFVGEDLARDRRDVLVRPSGEPWSEYHCRGLLGRSASHHEGLNDCG